MSNQIVAIIPARMAAQRFPGKPLAALLGKPMIQHVYERCVESKAFSKVCVATDDDQVMQHLRSLNGECFLTSSQCQSGTDRVFEVAKKLELSNEDIVLNVQGDEPAIHPQALSSLVEHFRQTPFPMGTLIRPLANEERTNPNVVKVVLNAEKNAIYFSRADIPFERNSNVSQKKFAHLGIYAFRYHALQQFCQWPQTQLEQIESLEQLRALYNGMNIHCVETPHSSVSVDVPGDVALAEAALKKLLPFSPHPALS